MNREEMTLSALTDPNPKIGEIDRMLSWDRLRDERVDSFRLIRDAKRMFRSGLSNQEAVHLLYELGGVLNVSKIYSAPADRFALRNFTLAAATTWIERNFKSDGIFPPKSVGKLYASFTHLGARIPKNMHKFLRDKIRESSDGFLAKDGARIIEYYAGTADSISPSVFEVAVKAVERDTGALMKSRQTGFLSNLAVIDAAYAEGYFPKGFDPKSVFQRNIAGLEASNIAIAMGQVDIAKKWFSGDPMPLIRNGLQHIKHVQESAKRLAASGFDIYSDFNCSATGDDTNGIDYTVGHESTDKRVGVIYDTGVKYVEGNAFPRVLYPSGRTIFNSAAVQRLHPDRVIVRLSTIAMNSFETAVIGRAFEDAFRAPANVYGLDERAQLQPIRKLVFKT